MITTAEIGPITRPEARSLAQAETAAMVVLLADLSPDEWARPTDCPGWDVRAMAGHVLGMTEGFTGLRRMATMFRAGGKLAGDGPLIDGVTAHQVAANTRLSTVSWWRGWRRRGPGRRGGAASGRSCGGCR